MLPALIPLTVTLVLSKVNETTELSLNVTPEIFFPVGEILAVIFVVSSTFIVVVPESENDDGSGCLYEQNLHFPFSYVHATLLLLWF